MGYCPNCNCDDCYFERNPEYGPPSPPMCNDCQERVQRFAFICNACADRRQRKWLDELKSYLPISPNMISREQYERLMREAQDA